MAGAREVAVLFRVDDQGSLQVLDAGKRALDEFGRAADDAGKRSEGAGKGVRDVGKGAEDAGKSFRESVSGVKEWIQTVTGLNQAIDLIGRLKAIVGTGIEFFKSGVNDLAQLKDVATYTGVATETLGRWRLALSAADVSTQEFGVAFRKMGSVIIDSSNDASSASAKLLTSLVGNVQQFRALKPEEQFLRLGDAVVKIEDPTLRTHVAMQLFGNGFQGVLRMFGEGRADVQGWIDFTDQLGAKIDQNIVEKADSISDAWAKIQEGFASIKTNFFAGLVDGLSQFSDGLVTKLLPVFQTLIANSGEFGAQVGETLAGIIPKIEAFADRAGQIGIWEAVKEQFQELQDWLQGKYIEWGDTYGPVVRDAGRQLGAAILEGMKDTILGGLAAIGDGIKGFFSSFFSADAVLPDLYAQRDKALSSARAAGTGTDQAAAYQAEAKAIQEKIAAVEKLAASEKAAEPPARVLADVATESAGAQRSAGAAASQASDGILKGAAAHRLFDSVVQGSTKSNKDLAGALNTSGNAAADAAGKLGQTQRAIAILENAAKSGADMAKAMRESSVATVEAAKGVDQHAAAAQKDAEFMLQQATAAAGAIAAAQDQAAQTQAYSDALEAAIASGLNYADAQEVAAEAQAKVADEQKVSAIEGTALAAVYKQTAAEARALAAAEAQRQAVLQAKDTTANLRLELQLTQQVNQGLITELDKKIEIARAQAGVNTALADELEAQERIKEAIADQETAYVHLGDIIKDSFGQAFDAVISGTRDLGDTLEGIGLGIGKRLFTSMLDSKLKDFDPTVKSNFLSLGDFGQGIFSNLFAGAGDGAGSYGVLLSDIAGGATDHGSGRGGLLSSLLGSGGSGGGLGLLANLAINSGGFFSKQSPGLSIGLSSLSLLNSGLTAATGTGIIGTLFGSGATSATLGSLLGETGGGIVTSLFGEAGSSALGTSLGAIGAGAGAVVGGIGGAYSAFQLGQGGMNAAQTTASVLSIVAGAAAILNAFPIIGTVIYAIVVAIAALAGALTKHTPMAAGLLRKQAESVLDGIKVFQDLQEGLGDITESSGNYKKGSKEGLHTFGAGNDIERNQLTGKGRARDRGFSEDAITNVTGFAGVFAANYFNTSSLVRDGNPVLMMAAQQSNVLSEFFSRAKMETGEYAEFTAGQLHKAFTEMGVDAVKGMGLINTLSQNYNKVLALQNDPKVADDKKQLFGVNVAESIRGVGAIFESGEDAVPPGVHIAALAIQTLEKDGQKAFGTLNGASSDFFVKLADDAENFDKVVNALLQQGFEINTDDFKNRLQDISASASFIGENIGEVFTGPSVTSGIDAMMEKLRSGVSEGLLAEGQKQLFDTTNIAASFEPVFAVLRELKDGQFDLTSTEGSQLFSADMVQAIAEGRANLEEYIPQLRAIRDAAKEVDDAIAEALKPTAEETAWIRLAEDLHAAREQAKQLAGELFSIAQTAEVAAPGSGAGKKAARESIRTSLNDQMLQQAGASAQEAVAKTPQADALAGAQLQWKAALTKALEDGVIDGAERANLTALRDKVQAAGKDFADAASAGADAVAQLFSATTEQAKGQIQDALGGATGSFFSKLQEDGASSADAVKAFGESFKQSIASNVFEGMQQALVQSAVLEGTLAPLMAGFKEAVAGALADGSISGAEQAGLDQFIQMIGKQTDATIAALGPTLNQFADLGKDLVGKGNAAKEELKTQGGDIRKQADETAKAGEDFSDAAGKMKEGVKAVADALPEDVTGGIKDGIGSLKDALGGADGNASAEIGAGLDKLREGLGGAAADDIKAGVGSLKDALGGDGNAAALAAGVGTLKDALGAQVAGPIAEGVDKLSTAFAPPLAEAMRDGVVTAVEAFGPTNTGTIAAGIDAMQGALAGESASSGFSGGLAALKDALGGAGEIVDPLAQAVGGAGQQIGALGTALGGLATLIGKLPGFGGIDGKATGGIVTTGSAVVGENGQPELVTATGTGFAVSPLSWTAARQLMHGGTPGHALGTTSYIPIGVRKSPTGWGPGGPFIKDANDPRHPDHQDTSAEGEDKAPDFASAIAAGFKKALEGAAADFVENFSESLADSVRTKLTDAIIEGFSARPDIEKESKAIDQQIEKAKDLASKGQLTPEKAAEISAEIAKHAAIITEQAKQLDPILRQLQKVEGIAAALEGLDFASSLKSLATLDMADSSAVDAWRKGLEDSTEQAVLQGIVTAMLATGPLAEVIQAFTEEMQKAMTDAFADDKLTEDEADNLGDIARKGAANIGAAMEALRPIFAALGLDLGDSVSKSAQKSKDIFKSALSEAFSDPGKFQTFDEFTKNIRGQLFQHIRDGLIQAFVDSALIQGALAPMLTAIQAIFTQIGQSQKITAQNNADIATQISLMLGVLNDPAMKAAFDQIAQSIANVAGQLGVTNTETKDLRDGFQDATDNAADACAGECNLAKRLAVTNLGIGQLSTLGREGSISGGLYVPYLPPGAGVQKFAAGGDVYRPTLALIGEAGPERVSKLGPSAPASDAAFAALSAAVRDLRGSIRGTADSTDVEKLREAMGDLRGSILSSGFGPADDDEDGLSLSREARRERRRARRRAARGLDEALDDVSTGVDEPLAGEIARLRDAIEALAGGGAGDIVVSIDGREVVRATKAALEREAKGRRRVVPAESVR